MASIYLRHADLQIPNQGCEAILQKLFASMCDPPGVTQICGQVGPFLNDLVPDCETVVGDLVVDDASLGFRETCVDDDCDGFLEGPTFDDGAWRIVIDQQNWTLGADPGPVTVYGYTFWTDWTLTPKILGIARFDEPVPLLEGDILKITASLIMPCSVTPPA